MRTTLCNVINFIVQFSIADPVRYQLLAQRTIPGFEPSAATYALAEQAYNWLFAPLRAVVDVMQEDLDLITAVMTGLIKQQLANDLGGIRWVDLPDDAVDLLMPRLKQRQTHLIAAGSGPTMKKQS